MKKARTKRLLQGGLGLALALALSLGLALPALAAYPDRPENQYVLDEAGVLSEETERDIIAKNQDLFEETGAQIVVAAVDFLDGEAIDDYAYSLFNIWGIGSQERNNGLLLLLAIGEDNYYAMPGYGIEDYFDGARLQSMLDEYLEPDFAARDYDAGVRKFFGEALSEMETYYADYSDEYTDQEPGGYYEEDYYYTPSFGERVTSFLGRFFGRVVGIVVIIVVLAVFMAILRSMRGGGGGGGSSGGGGGGFWSGLFLGNMLGRSHRRYGWRPPPPPPPGGFGPRPPRGGGGFGGFGGFSGGGRSGGGGGFRGGGGGFHGGGGSRGGGAGRR